MLTRNSSGTFTRNYKITMTSLSIKGNQQRSRKRHNLKFTLQLVIINKYQHLKQERQIGSGKNQQKNFQNIENLVSCSRRTTSASHYLQFVRLPG